MQSNVEELFVRFSREKLQQLFSRIESCVEKLSSEQVWNRASGNENAIGNLLLHLNGNVGQWIVSAVGGAPDARDRDSEFAARGQIEKSELLGRLRATLDQAFRIIERLDGKRLTERVNVQGYDVTVFEAVSHVVEHFAQHTGQIIFATKLMTHQDLAFYRHLGAAHSQTQP
jgi:uncharacterized damage-inducible protein DinB